MKYLLLLLISAVSFAQTFHTGVPARAVVPHAVDGKILYQVFESQSRVKPELMMEYCVLQHGLGFDQDAIQTLKDFGDVKVRDLLIDQNAEWLGDFNPDLMTFISYVYFNEELISKLLEDRCRKVVVSYQESNQSTIFEMTLRTEKFLKELGCGTEKTADTRGCGFLGHSKSGAVATMLVRRCMGRESAMGRDACLAMAEVYTASAMNEGTGASAILLGLKESLSMTGATHPLLGDYRNVLGFLNGSLAGIVEFTEAPLLDFLGDLNSDDDTKRGNPLWWDLSPIAYIEGTRRMASSHYDFAPNRVGFFEGEFAASGSEFDFEKKEGALSCGYPDLENPPTPKPVIPPLAKPTPAPAGTVKPAAPPQRGAPVTPPPVRYPRQQPPPPGWQPAPGRRDFRERPFMRNVVQPLWNAAADSAKSVPPTAPKTNELMKRVRNYFCHAYGKSLVEIHRADRAKALYDSGVQKWDTLFDTDDLRLVAALRPFVWKNYQVSDGLADRFTSLNVCERGREIKGSGVTSCRAYKNLSHMATSGMAPEAMLDIWYQLAPVATTQVLLSPRNQPDPLKQAQPKESGSGMPPVGPRTNQLPPPVSRPAQPPQPPRAVPAPPLQPKPKTSREFY